MEKSPFCLPWQAGSAAMFPANVFPAVLLLYYPLLPFFLCGPVLNPKKQKKLDNHAI
ncbi:MAG: hypothetical protein ACLTAC_36960 [Hungatella sp.]